MQFPMIIAVVVSIVFGLLYRTDFSNRADAGTTKRVLAELNDTERQKRVAQIKKWGYSTAWSGTGGSGRVDAYPDPLPSDQEATDTVKAGTSVVILGNDRYEFPFAASDWINPPEDLTKLAKAKGAVKTVYIPASEKPWIRKDGLLARGEYASPGRLYWSKWNGDGYDNNDIGPANPISWVLEQPFGFAFLPAPDNGEQTSEPGKPWYIVVSFYGFPTQASGGWTEQEAKDALPKLQTGHTWSLMDESDEEVNRGNLKEARATQIKPTSVLLLKDRTLPAVPIKASNHNYVPYRPGMTLMPGQSTSVGIQ